MEMSEQEGIRIAIRARSKAYSPYSKFPVGAALLTEENEWFEACNVENVSFGLTMCAERVAVGLAVSKGHMNFKLLIIVSDSLQPVVPCGACRQVLAEFAPNLRILSTNLRSQTVEFNLGNLLPLPRQGILG